MPAFESTRSSLPRSSSSKLRVALARGPEDVIAAQRLRHEVFASERGVALPTPIPGIDADVFDSYCDHLVVHDDACDAIVGTYRILPPERAVRLGRYYSETEFDLGSLAPLRSGLGELGRSCVAPGYRTGAVLQLLWAGIARYLIEHDVQFVMGCASIDARDGGLLARGIYDRLVGEHGSLAGYAVAPYVPLPTVAATESGASSEVLVPPLIKAYLRAGAVVCGPPAFDAAFRTADLLLLLDVADLTPRYARHFFESQEHGTEMPRLETALT